MAPLVIRNMKKDEVKLALEWAAQEGWNPGLKDDECFFAADPHGFFIGYVNEQPAAMISAVAYDENFAFMGFYIVKPAFRGRGYGMEIWKKALAYLGNRNIGGDGVSGRIEDYQTQGFKPAYRNIRFRIKAPGSQGTDRNLTDISRVSFSALCRYDRFLFPAERSLFLKCWISQPGHYGLAYQENGAIKGFGVIRKCFHGFKVGPLFADSPEIAENLLKGLISFCPCGEDVFLDIPQVNAEAMALAAKYPFQKVFETIRIYTREAPRTPLEKWYGVTSFECG